MDRRGPAIRDTSRTSLLPSPPGARAQSRRDRCAEDVYEAQHEALRYLCNRAEGTRQHSESSLGPVGPWTRHSPQPWLPLNACQPPHIVQAHMPGAVTGYHGPPSQTSTQVFSCAQCTPSSSQYGRPAIDFGGNCPTGHHQQAYLPNHWAAGPVPPQSFGIAPQDSSSTMCNNFYISVVEPNLPPNHRDGPQRVSRGSHLHHAGYGSTSSSGCNAHMVHQVRQRAVERHGHPSPCVCALSERLLKLPTTLMMRNIPNRYVQEELLGDINAAGFADLFDFFYLPMDHETRANFGYCFINLVSPQQASNFFKAFDGKPLRRFTSNKIVAIVPAAIQGFEANLKHYSRKAVCTDVEIQFRPLFWLHGAAVEFVRKSSGESRVVASGGCGSTRHGNTNHIAFVMAGDSSSEETRAGDDSDWKASYKKEKGPPAFRPTGVISPTSSLPNDDHSPVVHHRHRRTKSDGGLRRSRGMSYSSCSGL